MTWRDDEYARLGITEPQVLSTAKKRRKKHPNLEPIYISTNKPRTVGPNDHGNNWPGNISKSKKAHKEGIPLYSDKLATEFCERMCMGEAPSQICKDPRMPTYPTVVRWTLSKDPQFEAFQAMYEEAKKIMWMYHADQLLQVVDDSTNDYMERYNPLTKQTEEVFNQENVQRSKLRFEARKFLLARMLPHIYGEKMDISVGGRDGKPIQAVIMTVTAEEAEKAYLNMINGDDGPKKLSSPS